MSSKQSDGAGMTTALYSRLPAEHDNPWVVIERARQVMARLRWRISDRDGYPTLPWTLDELPGTRWRNLWSGSLECVDRLGSKEMHGNQPVGLPVPIRLGPYMPGQQWLHEAHIGFYDRDRFIIEHWVRVDHLPTTVQREWYGVQIASCHRQIAQLERTVAEDIRRHDNANRNMHRRELKYAQERLQGVLAMARDYAAKHGLELTPAMVNEWMFGHGDDEQRRRASAEPARVEQLVLFA